MSIEMFGLSMEEPLSEAAITGLYLYYGGNDGRVDTSDKIKYLEEYAIVHPIEVNFAKMIDIALGSEKPSEVPGVIALMLKLSISKSGIESLEDTLDKFQNTQFAKFFSDSKFKFADAVSYIQNAKVAWDYSEQFRVASKQVTEEYE